MMPLAKFIYDAVGKVSYIEMLLDMICTIKWCKGNIQCDRRGIHLSKYMQKYLQVIYFGVYNIFR